MIEKVTRMNALYDAYETLLTPKQMAYFKAYYLEDWSLAEIASDYEVSRTAVFDNIKRTEKLLEDYEQKLALVMKKQQRDVLLEQLEVLVQDEAKLLVASLQALE